MKRLVILVVLLIIIIIQGVVLHKANAQNDELTSEIEDRNSKIAKLKEEIENQELRMSALRNYNSNLQNQAYNAASATTRARQHLRDAEFWSQSGNEFFTGVEYDNAKRELDNFR